MKDKQLANQRRANKRRENRRRANARRVTARLAVSVSFASDWYRVDRTFGVRFSLQAGQLSCEWMPCLPTPQEKAALLDRYRAVRDEFLADFADQIGGNVGCVEVRS